jgi:hypothetical protein
MTASTLPELRAVRTAEIPTVIGGWPAQPPITARRSRRVWGGREWAAVVLGTGLLPWSFLLGLHAGWWLL